MNAADVRIRAGAIHAFFHRDGDLYIPTELTRGPWSAQAQHGGPPAALLGTAMERTEGRDGAMVVRATFEMLKPVPLAPLTLSTRMLSAGRSVQLIGGVLSSGGEEILRAQAVRMRLTDVPFDEPPLPPPPPGPDQGKPATFFPTGYDVGYHSGMEASFVRGGFLEQGPAVAWLNLHRYPEGDWGLPRGGDHRLASRHRPGGIGAARPARAYRSRLAEPAGRRAKGPRVNAAVHGWSRAPAQRGMQANRSWAELQQGARESLDDRQNRRISQPTQGGVR